VHVGNRAIKNKTTQYNLSFWKLKKKKKAISSKANPDWLIQKAEDVRAKHNCMFRVIIQLSYSKSQHAPCLARHCVALILHYQCFSERDMVACILSMIDTAQFLLCGSLFSYECHASSKANWFRK